MSSWKDLLQGDDDRIVLPYTGQRQLHSRTQVWTIRGTRPRVHGWYEFRIHGRNAEVVAPVEYPPDGVLGHTITGYLVGNRLAADVINANVPIDKWGELFERVYFVPLSVDRFTRITAGRMWRGGELIFHQLAMPLGPEPDVMRAYLDRKVFVRDVAGVTPALEMAFNAETIHRELAEAARAEVERQRVEEEARRQAEERRANLAKQLGDGAGRREMARVDFPTAARAALAVGGATLLDWKIGYTRHEYVVSYQVDNERLQCVVDETMHVVDAGVCLTSHETGFKGDTLFTLESLPAVIRQAIREDRLVIWRHV